MTSTAGELDADAILGGTAEVLAEDQEDRVDQVALGVFLCIQSVASQHYHALEQPKQAAQTTCQLSLIRVILQTSLPLEQRSC